jgi:hypothetical protein
MDDEHDDDILYPSMSYRTHRLERLLNHLLALAVNDDRFVDDIVALDRHTKGITKGDPREFMG